MSIVIAQIIFIGTAVALIAIILLQQAKSGGMGASFGGGASGTVFGARGAGTFLYKFTRILALVFFISALVMGYVQNKAAVGDNILLDNQFEQKSASGVDVPLSNGHNNAPASDASIPLEGR